MAATRPNSRPARQAAEPSRDDQGFRAFYAKAVRAAELARRTGAGTGQWPYHRPHPVNRGPLDSSR